MCKTNLYFSVCACAGMQTDRCTHVEAWKHFTNSSKRGLKPEQHYSGRKIKERKSTQQKHGHAGNFPKIISQCCKAAQSQCAVCKKSGTYQMTWSPAYVNKWDRNILLKTIMFRGALSESLSVFFFFFCLPCYFYGVHHLGEIFAFVTISWSNHTGSHILSSRMVHAGCVFVASIHLSRT